MIAFKNSRKRVNITMIGNPTPIHRKALEFKLIKKFLEQLISFLDINIRVELSKKKINVALNGDQFGDENIIVDDFPFKSTLIYVNSEEASVDLFQLYGAQTQMDRYGALAMDKLFTVEEIKTITEDEFIKDA
ncbi:unnamed protein product [Adineta steineri]|uniref:Uncharacterized protein n=2 Tax=Adineta steineri TaxID=433720 RepID=A0A815DBR2_9BILA|nr:unnamed protein product [Adineta steineri]